MIKSPAVGRKLGSVWEEKGYTKVSQIFISYTASRVCSVQFQFVDPNGSLVLSPLHGSDYGATCFSVIHLDVQTEFVTGLSGYGKSLKESETIWGQSCDEKLPCLTITTNIRTYGPFGEPNPNSNRVKFDVQLGDNEAFGGFHGTSTANHRLMSVGLFVKPRDRLPLLSSSVQVKKEPIYYHNYRL